MATVTDLMTEVKTLNHDLRTRVDEMDKEQKSLREELTSKSGAMPAEYKQNINDLNARIDSLLEQIQIEAQRPRNAAKESKRSAAREAFIKAIRKHGDLSRLSSEEKALIVPDFMPADQKALYAGDATTGGFFASTDFMDELQAYKLLISPMRKICRIQKTSGEKVQMPSLTSDTAAYWATEQASFNNSQDPTLSMINIPVHELRGLLKISQQNLEDSQFDLESFIKERLGMQFAKTEGASFVSGSGNGQPRGLLSFNIKASASYTGGSAGKNNVTDAIPYVPSGSTTAITADNIITILMDLKSTYAPTSTFILTRSTLGVIRLFKDSQNRPLWQPFAAGDLPATIYDRPYVETPDMPEIGANNYCLALGDFSNYMIVDRVTMNMQQLNELFAVQGLVGYIARARVGGDILLPESFRLLKCSVS